VFHVTWNVIIALLLTSRIKPLSNMGEPPCFSSISNIPGLQPNYSNIENTMSDVKDKTGQPIEVGDHVYTKIRGGRHEGDVRCLAPSAYMGGGLMDAGVLPGI
jgi:hypothetical protein